MGPLIFVARKHQIQRKKSNLNMRLMQIQNKREQVAEQIGQAQSAKTARQNLFNSTNRLAQNSIMTMMNLMNGVNSYTAGNALNTGLFNAMSNMTQMNNAFKVKDGVSYLLCGESAGPKFAGFVDTSKPVDANLNYVNTEGMTQVGGAYYNASQLENGQPKAGETGVTIAGYQTKDAVDAASYNAHTNSLYQKQISDAYAASQAGNLAQMGTQLALNNLMNSGNLFSNMINNINDLSDNATLEELHALDSQLEQEQTTVETQIKMLEAELQAVDKQLDNEIKQAAPKFSLGG